MTKTYKGSISYEKLLKRMRLKNIKKQMLRETYGISASTIHKINHNQPISLTSILCLCEILDCQPGDILTYIPEDDILSQDYIKLLNEWQCVITVADLEQKLQNFRILFAYHSNKIENPDTTYHNTREIFENGKVISYTGDLRTIYEIKNQKECYEFLREKIIHREPITVALIKKIHKILMEGCYDENRYQKGERPGEFKKGDYVTGDGVGLLPSDVPEEMEFLCKEINGNYSGNAVLTAASYFHLNFESIHPFADGNGRVGRTLMNYFLMIHQHPPAIFYEEDKEVYYMALATFDKTENIDGFRKFLEEQTIKTWAEKRRRTKNLELSN